MAEPQVAITPPSPVAAAPASASTAAKQETFAQQMERFGGFSGQDGGSEPPAEATKEAPAPAPAAKTNGKGKKAAAKGKAETAVAEATPAAQAEAAPAINKLDQLKALAAELDLEFDGAKVAVRERVEFREAKDRLRRQIEQQEAEVLRRLEEAKTQLSSKLTKAEQIEKAYEAADYDGLAKLLGPADWNALQQEMIEKISDPNYKRLRELERREKERESQAEQQRQHAERVSYQQQQAEAMRTHVANLTEQMKQSADPLVREMHDDPLFINSVIEVQRQNWDGSTTVSPEKAIKIAAKGFTAPLSQSMKALYEKLHRVFGATQQQAAAIVAAVAPTANAEVGKNKANKTGVVPSGGADVASAPKVFKTKKEKDAEFSRRLAEAIAEENLNEQQR